MKNHFNTTSKPEIMLYDVIGYDTCRASEIVKALRQHEHKHVSVRINSPGGLITDGWAIHTALTKHPGGCTVYIDGLAASMASVIAMAGTTVHMADGAMLMIHDPWTVAIGDAEDLRKNADLLDSMKANLIRAYESKTRLSKAEITGMMAAETWLTAREAEAKRFIDVIDPALRAAAQVKLHSAAKEFAHIAKRPEASVISKVTTKQCRAGELIGDNAAQADLYDEYLAASEPQKTLLMRQHREVLEAEQARRKRGGQSRSGTPSNTPHLDQWNALQGGEKTAYFREHKTAILVEADRLDRGAPTSQGQQSTTPHLDHFLTLTGAEKTRYWDAHSRAILAEGEIRDANAPAPANVPTAC